jgi:flagellar basal body-associated protein FliL
MNHRPPATRPPRHPQKKKKDIPVIILVVSIIITIGALVAVFVYFH